ncbi:unnamed protein product [Lactuca saligna]|uniref:Protein DETOXIFICATION n=1 Tax=Lactuca saligna TaxID=75948 RepID=A0AA35ZQ65_LACSI|nr:unnamed protein product [Lactuca saligna]
MKEEKVIQDPLIQRQHEEEEEELGLRRQVYDEVKKQIGLSCPLIAVSLLQYCLEVISIMFVGHLGQLPLSSASMATSFASFTGFSVLLGMGSALETLCGQSYGAKQYHMLGIQMQRAMLTLTTLSIPLAFIWFYTPTIFIALGFGIKGAALANTISNWMNVVFLGFYVKFSNACLHTWTGFSKEAFNDVLSFMKLAVPSALMICLEYWTFDMVVLLSGLLPNPKLETSVLSISLNTCWMVYMISVGLGGAISTRVSNELGASRPKAARLAVCVVVVIAILEGLIVGTITILVRNVWGKLYSNDEEVIKYVAKMMPLLALSDFLDGFQCVLSGAARGCGWQNVCAIINLGAYYVVGIPCALLFAFVLHVGGMGLWMGIICALSVQVVALVAINLSTNWNDEAWKAINRVQTSIGSE